MKWICAALLASWILFMSWAGNAVASTAEECFREGYMASMAREWDEAITWYSKAIALNPKDHEVYFQRGLVFETIRRPDQAIADYEKALKLKPNYYLAIEYLAKLYVDKGQYNQAIDLYSRALTLIDDPKWRSVLKWWLSEAKRKMDSRVGNVEGR